MSQNCDGDDDDNDDDDDDEVKDGGDEDEMGWKSDNRTEGQGR